MSLKKPRNAMLKARRAEEEALLLLTKSLHKWTATKMAYFRGKRFKGRSRTISQGSTAMRMALSVVLSCKMRPDRKVADRPNAEFNPHFPV